MVLGYIGVSTSFAGDEPKEMMESAGKDKMGMDEEMMKKWMEYATPNENHKVLDALVGEWDYALKWWQAPGTEPEQSTGTSKIKWIMDGRFIKHKIEGTSAGMPFKGMGITGYNNETNKYESVWIDNMGTGMVIGSGTYNADKKIMTEVGTFSSPGEGEKKYRAVIINTNIDSFMYQLYMPGPDNKEYLAMVINYTRKKQ
ncbi:MAG: DUF1579 domain-containing protein [Candidatus Dadabacteria bacterium]|nr:DUF1579 domain-containing protein [Candidatus Dadabacteria bacterium]